MCGIAGIARSDRRGVSVDALSRMAGALRHRGPDGYGFFADEYTGLAHVRLALVDRLGGAQPMTSEDERVIVVCNGEIFNHVELREQLKTRGHVFRSRCDIEVLAHAWEEWGEALLPRLNGQFALAIYDRRDRSLFLARDRFGIVPLFFASCTRSFVFASEAKGLFASGELEARADVFGLDQVFTFWAAMPPRTVFESVRQLQPGCSLTWRNGTLTHRRWHEFSFDPAAAEPRDALDRLGDLITSSVALRMCADTPVGAYLSGGLDSSIICGTAARTTSGPLQTLSVTFDESPYDESASQLEVAAALGSEHHSQRVGAHDVASAFVPVIGHIETPILRSAPVAMHLLAGMTNQLGTKVVLTGEGADEVFLGYDLFKEASVRRFCLRQPSSDVRPRLFDRLYPYLGHQRSGEFWRRFFLASSDVSDPLFSHLPRFATARWIRGFYSDDLRDATSTYEGLDELRAALPGDFDRWHADHQATYLEMVTLMSPYLLASQGDRVAMSHAVETRYPFLDHRLVEFAMQLPPHAKLRGLRDKDILRRWARSILPATAAGRRKTPFRSPDVSPFVSSGANPTIDDLLQEESLTATGYFRAEAVHGLLRRCRTGHPIGVREHQALVAILSTQAWHQRFIAGGWRATCLPLHGADVLLGSALSCDGAATCEGATKMEYSP